MLKKGLINLKTSREVEKEKKDKDVKVVNDDKDNGKKQNKKNRKKKGNSKGKLSNLNIIVYCNMRTDLIIVLSNKEQKFSINMVDFSDTTMVKNGNDLELEDADGKVVIKGVRNSVEDICKEIFKKAEAQRKTQLEILRILYNDKGGKNSEKGKKDRNNGNSGNKGKK